MCFGTYFFIYNFETYLYNQDSNFYLFIFYVTLYKLPILRK